MDIIHQYIIPTSSVQYLALQNIQALLISQLVADIVNVLKAVSLLLSLALAAGIVYFVIKTNVVGTKIGGVQSVVSPSSVKKNRSISDAVKKAQGRLARVNAEEDRSAVIEATHALDEALKELGHEGATRKDVLAKVQAWKSTSSSEVGRAYELRTRIVHYPHASVSHDEATGAVEICAKALKDLGFM